MQIPNVGEKLDQYQPKGTIHLGTLYCQSHVINGHGIHGGAFGGIEDELVLLPFLDKLCWGVR